MEIAFWVLALWTAGSAVAAMSCRNLIHCALFLALTLAGVAAFYLQLQAAFVGFVQVLVYIGAVAVLVVFAIVLTRPRETVVPGLGLPKRFWGVAVAAGVFGALAAGILSGRLAKALPAAAAASAPTKTIGVQLMTTDVLVLEVAGLLLTVALFGAVLIAMQPPRQD